MRTQLPAASLVLATSSTTQAQDLYIRNARILDPAAKTDVAGNTLIQGGRMDGWLAWQRRIGPGGMTQGSEATLLVLDKSPIENIHNSRRSSASSTAASW